MGELMNAYERYTSAAKFWASHWPLGGGRGSRCRLAATREHLAGVQQRPRRRLSAGGQGPGQRATGGQLGGRRGERNRIIKRLIPDEGALLCIIGFLTRSHLVHNPSKESILVA